MWLIRLKPLTVQAIESPDRTRQIEVTDDVAATYEGKQYSTEAYLPAEQKNENIFLFLACPAFTLSRNPPIGSVSPRQETGWRFSCVVVGLLLAGQA